MRAVELTQVINKQWILYPIAFLKLPRMLLDIIITSAHTLARSLHDVSCANNNRKAVVVWFRLAFHASGMRFFFEIFEFKFFLKFCTIMMT